MLARGTGSIDALTLEVREFAPRKLRTDFPD